jgi:hypothetical protein
LLLSSNPEEFMGFPTPLDPIYASSHTPCDDNLDGSIFHFLPALDAMQFYPTPEIGYIGSMLRIGICVARFGL